MQHPALLFSGGKDSLVLLRLAEKAFRPGAFPFPLLHIDTGHNFPEVIAFRDRRAAELGERLIVRSVEDSIASGRVVLRNRRRKPQRAINRSRCSTPSPSSASTPASAARAATRKRRAPRNASFRSAMRSVSGTRRTSGPSSGICTTRASHPGENMRVFPISNWTEIDVWQYIAREQLEVPSHLFRASAAVVRRGDGCWCR